MRISEALTILSVFTPAAIPGLFVGCIVANVFVGNGPIDIRFGSLTTLVEAFLTHNIPMRYRYLAPLPPVVLNAVVSKRIEANVRKLAEAIAAENGAQDCAKVIAKLLE